jgi:peptidoglycan/LPS O-acetylase OafA/YrhL
MLPAFTLLVPVALALARRRRGTALAVVGAAVLASAWFGGYALTGWSYAI